MKGSKQADASRIAAIILQVWYYALANSMRELLRRRKFDLVVIACGGFGLVAWIVSLTANMLDAVTPLMEKYPIGTIILAGLVAVALGSLLGNFTMGWVWARTNRDWLILQPISEEAIRSASRLISGLVGVGQGVAFVGTVFLVSYATHAPRSVELYSFLSVLYLPGYLLGLLFKANFLERSVPVPSHELARKGGRMSWLGRLATVGPLHKSIRLYAMKLDQNRPRWIWLLAHEGSIGRVLVPTFFAAVGLAVSIASIWAASTLLIQIVAIAAGHLTFLYLLRCGTLTTASLRIQPITYFSAWFGLVRLPTIFSLFVSLITIAPVIKLSGASFDIFAEVGFTLIMLNCVYAFLLSGLPANRRVSLLIYLLAIGMVIYEYTQLNNLVFPGLLIFSLIFLFRGWRNFYLYG